MDRWACEQLAPWLEMRSALLVGALSCILRGPIRGWAWGPAAVRTQLHAAAARAGVTRRFAPHQLRHAHAVEMSRVGVALLVIRRQLGYADLAITSVYLRGIDNAEIVHTFHERPAPWSPRKACSRVHGNKRALHRPSLSPPRSETFAGHRRVPHQCAGATITQRRSLAAIARLESD